MLLWAVEAQECSIWRHFPRAGPVNLATRRIPVLFVMLNGAMMGRFSDVTRAWCEGDGFTV